MTTTQALRIERRSARKAQERYERAQMMSAAIVVLFTLAAFLLAGTVDHWARTQGLGASMVPSAEYVSEVG